jgi:hypothetical protein
MRHAEACLSLDNQYWGDWAASPVLLTTETFGQCCRECNIRPNCTRFTFWLGQKYPCRLFAISGAILFSRTGPVSYQSKWFR